MVETSEYDVIVVGAGPIGIIAAHTWLSAHTDSSLLLLEGDSDLGGPWSASRVYPGFMTQSPRGMLEYGCFPMKDLKLPTDSDFYGFYPASQVITYLDAFANSKAFNGKTIKDRIVFSCRVSHISRLRGKDAHRWLISTENGQNYSCAKLIVATGLTSNAALPLFPVPEAFTTPIIHAKDLNKQATFLRSPEVKTVVLIGSSKSAIDAIQLLLRPADSKRSETKTIHWLARESKKGPVFVCPASAPPPLANTHDFLSIKFFANLSPCILSPPDRWAKFWHRNPVGKWICKKLWALQDWNWKKDARYGKRGGVDAALKPGRAAFWEGEGVSLENSPDFWDALKKPKVYRDEIERVEGKDVVVLKGGEKIRCDVVVACTGWRPAMGLFDQQDAVTLGLPVPKENVPPKNIETWESRIQQQDVKVLEAFPSLAKPPPYEKRILPVTPFLLYRNIAPIGDEDRSIVILGHVGTTQMFLVGEIQSLWATSYLDGSLKLPKADDMKDAIALTLAWRLRRYLGDAPGLLYDQIPYLSMLLRDLGLEDRRKKGWRELFKPYLPSDYQGTLEEWLDVRKGKSPC